MKRGFTVVELLIVIVVIGILATLTIIAYSGVQDQARAASLKSDLEQNAKILEAYKYRNAEAYPASLAAAQTAGVKISSGNTPTYYYNAQAKQYCFTMTNGTQSQYVYSGGEVSAGTCEVTSGLIGWWKMNNSGADSGTNGYTATISNATSAAGQGGTANTGYSFNGSNASLRVANNANFYQPTTSVSFWVSPNAWSAGTATNFVVSRSSGSDGFFIFYLNGTSTLTYDCGGSSYRWNTGYTPPLGAWTFITVTCTGSARQLYVNGQLRATGPAGNIATLSNSSDLLFGLDGSGYALNGFMDDARLYSRVLSAPEVEALYAAGAQ